MHDRDPETLPPPAEPDATPTAAEPPVPAPVAVEHPPAVEPPSAGGVPAIDAPVAALTAPEAPVTEAPVAEAPVAEAPAAEAPADVPPAPKPPDPANEEKRRRAQEAWERVVRAREANETVTGFVTAAVKGGLLVDVTGIRGFLPASQIRTEPGVAVESLVRTRLPIKVIDLDAARRRVVVSHRRAADDERRTRRQDVLRSLAIGQRRDATVVRLTDFGAFVDLGGVDGLIPMSELAFERVDKAADVLTIGETLQVEVIRIDEGGKKIALSRKNALPDPWRDHADVVRPGATLEGTVVGKERRLQVEIAPGVVGAVRESDADPNDYELGEKIEVTVRNVDRRTRRITLTTLHGAAAMPPTSSGFAPLGIELGRRT